MTFFLLHQKKIKKIQDTAFFLFFSFNVQSNFSEELFKDASNIEKWKKNTIQKQVITEVN